MVQILPAYGLSKETVASIMILYKNTKVKVRLSDGDTDFFDIVAGVLQGDTLALYLFIISVHNLPILRTSKVDRSNERKWLYTKKAGLRTLTTRMTAFLVNTPTQAESLQHSLEQAVGGIRFYLNADKTEYMCFNQNGDIVTLNDGSLKLVDKFTCQGSNVSSIENDIIFSKHGLLSISYQSYGSQAYPIK